MQQHAASVVDALQAHIAILDERGAVLAVNRAWRTYGAAHGGDPRHADEGANYLGVCDAAARQGVPEARAMAAGIRAVLARQQAAFELEYPCHGGGQRRWFVARVTAFTAADRPHAVVAHEDVTARHIAQADLRRLEAAIDQVSDAVVITTPELDRPGPQIVYVNPAFERITGYTAAEALGQTPRILQGPRTDRETLERLKRTLRAGDTFRGRAFNYRKSGEEYTAEWAVTPVLDDAGHLAHYVSIQRDVTAEVRAADEARRREADLAHVGRLSMLGELASGLAHELNQPLAAIANYTKGCLRRMAADDWDRPALAEAIRLAAEQADRAGQIMRRMRQFVRKREPRFAPTRLADVAADSLALLAHETHRAGVELVVDVPPTLPPLDADEVQLTQVLVNLLRNALDALAQQPAGRRRLEVLGRAAAGDRVELLVRDSGPPVPPEHERRMFEPFFSTKPEGMGMGLPISRTLVESHGGRLTADPNPAPAPGGMTFTMTLPAGRAAP